MIRQPGQTSYYYLPLLETKPGKVYLNTGTASVVDVETYNGFTPVGDQVTKSGILSINTGSDPIYQGRVALSYSGTSFELDYNGNKWSDSNGSVVPSSFYLALDYKDAAWVVSGAGSAVADLFPVTSPAYSPMGGGGGGPIMPPNAPTGPTYSYAGGSRVALQVIPLVMPEVASVSPSSITANGIQQAITITLKRPLNPAQNPNVVFSSSELTIVPGVVANKNNYGSIIGWTVNVIAPSQAYATGNISMAASEALQYLKVDSIVTEAVTYMTSTVVGSLSIAGAIAATINSITVTAPNTTGWTSTSNGTQEYAGNILVAVTAQSTANNFSSAKIIAKPDGTTSRIDLGTATPNGQPYTGNTTSGGIVYYQDYTLTVDTGTLLNTSQSYDIGASVTTVDLVTTTLWSSNVFWNCNPTSQFSAYSMFCQVNSGTGTSASSLVWHTTGGIPATNWTSSGGAIVNPLALVRTSTGLVFSVQEVWTKQAGAKDPVLKAELRLGASPGTLLATTTTRDASGALVFPAILPAVLPVGTDSLFVRIYSQASTYTFSGIGYLDTPAQPVVMALTGGRGCFVPETYVMTVDGPKKINDIKIGDLVMSIHEKDYESGVVGIRPFRVSDKLVHNDKPYSTLNVNGVLTTDEHVWATDGSRFDRADTISKVMALDLVDQTPVAITAVKLNGSVVPEVQNLTVEDAHTFLVAPSMFGPWFLVHNMKSQTLYL